MPQPHQKRRPQKQRQAQPNKAQQREALIRAEQMAAEPDPDLLPETNDPVAGLVDEPEPVVPVRAPERSAPAPAAPSRRRGAGERTRRAVINPAAPAVTREQEYAFIRADMRRLLITAGAVVVVMVALLFVVEG